MRTPARRASRVRVDPEAAPAGRVGQRVLFLEEEIDRVERNGARRRAAARLLDRQVGGEQPVRQPGGSGGDFVAPCSGSYGSWRARRKFGGSAYETRPRREPIFRPMQITRRAEFLSARGKGSRERRRRTRRVAARPNVRRPRRRMESSGRGRWKAGNYWLAIFSTGASASTDAACEAARCEANASANSAACVPTVSSCATTFGSEQLSALSKRVSSVFTVAPNGVGQPRSAMHDRTQRRQHGAGRLPAVGRDDQADRTAVEIRAIVRAQFLERVECVLHEAGDAAVIAGRRDDDRVGLLHGVDQFALRVGQRFVFGRVVRQRMQERAVEQPRACAGRLRAAQCERQRAFGRRRCPGGTANADDERAAVLIECSQGALLGMACPAKHRLKTRW